MNEIIQSLYDRKSMRAFEDRPVPAELKAEILAAAAAVTDDNDHDGVAKAIERYILGTLAEEPPVPSPAR